MRLRLQICVLALALPLAGCNVFELGDEADRLEALRANRQKWQQQAPASYSFVLQRSCFCGTEMSSPVRITVANGERQSVQYVGTGEPMRQDWLQFFPTMDGVFDLLEQAIRDADEIEISYDPQRGHPLHVSVDRDKRAIDDEYSLTISQVNF